MAAVSFGVLGAAVGDHGADVGIGAAAEPAAERAVGIPLERLVVATVRIARAAIRHERPELRSLFPAVDADERSALGSLEKGVVAASGGMERAGVVQECPGVRVRPSAVFAVFAHGLTCFRVSPGRVPARERVSRARSAAQAETPGGVAKREKHGVCQHQADGTARARLAGAAGWADGTALARLAGERNWRRNRSRRERESESFCTRRHYPPWPR